MDNISFLLYVHKYSGMVAYLGPFKDVIFVRTFNVLSVILGGIS